MANEKFTLMRTRLAFGSGLFQKSDFNGDGKFKHKVKLIVPPNHPQRAALVAVIQKIAKDEWKEKGPAIVKSITNNAQKFCWLDGDNYPDTEGFAGNHIIACSSKTRPTTMDSDGITQVDQESGIIYSGCYGNALLEFRTFEGKEGKGIYCTIRGFQFVGKGDAFSGGPPPADASEFAGLSTASEQVDSDDL